MLFALLETSFVRFVPTLKQLKKKTREEENWYADKYETGKNGGELTEKNGIFPLKIGERRI